MRGDLFTAVPYLRNSVAIANSIGDLQGSLGYRTTLGAVFLDLGHDKMAEQMLMSVINIVEDVGRMAHWHQTVPVYAHLALSYLGSDKWIDASQVATYALKLAEESGRKEYVGMVWHVLGRVLTQAPSKAKPLVIDDTTISATKAFARSLKSFEEAYGGGIASYREQILTMLTWADYADSVDQGVQGDKLRERARNLAEAIEMALPEY